MKNKLKVLSILFLSLIVGLSTSAVSAAPKDVTSDFSLKMRQNGAWIAYYALTDKEQGTYPLGTGMLFAEYVQPGGDWDYKLTLGTNTPYKYAGYDVTGEDLGNMHYGFVGRFAGFSKNLLLTAAGAVQIYAGTAQFKWYKTYFDDPNDQHWIDHGIRRFDNGTIPMSSDTSIPEVDIDTSLIHLLTDEEKQEIRKMAIERSNEIKAELKNSQEVGE